MRRSIVLVLLLVVGAACSGSDRVIVAAGTTLVDGGLLDELVERFEEDHPGIDLSVVGEASAQILELGRRGGADVLITHAPRLEAEFVADGLAARYEQVLASSFVIVGPPGRIGGGTAAEEMRAIAQSGRFVSRADGSGTHEVEMGLWAAAGINPTGQPWYLETGQGMGLTLQVADQRDAYTLSELGAFLASADTLNLQVVEVTDPPPNPYHLIVVADSPVQDAGEIFLEWLLGEDGRSAIEAANEMLFGQQVYTPGD